MIIHNGVVIQKQDRFYRCLGFNGDSKSTIIKGLERLTSFIERAFRENADGYMVLEQTFQYPDTSCAAFGTAPVNHHRAAAINKSKNRDSSYFFFSEHTKRLFAD